eukprot:1137586-Pelagomonas_calceolata.AAC.1
MDGAGMLHVRPRPTPCTHLLVQWVPGEDAHAIWRLLREQVHEGHEAPPALELTGQKVQVLVGLQGGRVESEHMAGRHGRGSLGRKFRCNQQERQIKMGRKRHHVKTG